ERARFPGPEVRDRDTGRVGAADDERAEAEAGARPGAARMDVRAVVAERQPHGPLLQPDGRQRVVLARPVELVPRVGDALRAGEELEPAEEVAVDPDLVDARDGDVQFDRECRPAAEVGEPARLAEPARRSRSRAVEVD